MKVLIYGEVLVDVSIEIEIADDELDELNSHNLRSEIEGLALIKAEEKLGYGEFTATKTDNGIVLNGCGARVSGVSDVNWLSAGVPV